MSVDAKGEIIISRSREKVAAFMFDPKNDKLWIGGLKNAFPQSPGLLEKGSKVERIGDFLNRAYSANVLVVNSEPNKFVELSSDEPFEMKVRYELADVDNGTEVKLRIQSIGENDYKQVPAALFAKAVNEAVKSDLAALKKRVENGTS
jgi:Polyketide cyclase / dehydrase and lipid transport.